MRLVGHELPRLVPSAIAERSQPQAMCKQMVTAVPLSNFVYKKDYSLMTPNLIIIFKLFWVIETFCKGS